MSTGPGELAPTPAAAIVADGHARDAGDVAAGDWSRLDAELDRLLDLPDDARGAHLDAIATAEPDRARALREWLAAIAASGGFLETAVDAVASAPDRLGPWRVIALAGRGGMGEVFLAERADGAFERRVAIKVLRRDVRVDPARLARERALLARLDHPRIARLIDGGEAPDGRPYLVTEWVDGVSLGDWLASRQPDLATRLDVFMQLGEAVAFAHANLVVHRDLKPGNVLVDAGHRVKLLDFGIARLVEAADTGLLTQDHVLTPQFAAPEQLAGAAITTRTDVHALGALLHLLLTGRPPHDLAGLPLRALVERVCDHDPPLASRATGAGGVPASALRGDLDAIVATALARDPARRYASVEALLRDLAAHRAHRPVSVRPPSMAGRAARFVRRHRLGAALVTVAAASLVAGAIGVYAQGVVAQRERDVARAERDAAQNNAERYAVLNNFLVRVFRDVGNDAERLSPPEFLARAATLVDTDGPRDAATRVQLLATIADLQSLRGDPVATEKAARAVLAQPALAPAQSARAHCQLGGARMRQGDLDAALVEIDRGLSHSRALTGTAREEHAFCVAIRAQLHATKGEFDAAVALLDGAWRELSALPPTPSTTRRLAYLAHNLGNVYAMQDRDAEALPWFDRAIAASEDVGEGRSQDAAQSQLSRAGALNGLGRLAEAGEAYERALPLLERYLGDSPSYLVELTNSVNVLNAMEEGARARARLEQVLAISARLGIDDATTRGQAHLEFGKASVLLHDHARALRELALADAAFRDGLGTDHPYAWFSRFTRARVYAAQGDLPAVQRELGPLAEHFADDPGMRGRALQLLAELELDAGANGAAQSDARDALTLLQQALPATHHLLAWTQVTRARALSVSDDPAERAKAGPMFDAALPVLVAAFGERHSKVTRTRAWRAQAAAAPGQ